MVRPFHPAQQRTLNTQSTDLVKMRVVNVGVDTEQTTQNDLGSGHEVGGELDTDTLREQLVVVEQALRPGHEGLDVRRGREVGGLLVRLAVLPVELVLWPSVHDRALGRRTELGDGAVQHVDVVEKVNNCRELVRLNVNIVTHHALRSTPAGPHPRGAGLPCGGCPRPAVSLPPELQTYESLLGILLELPLLGALSDLLGLEC